MRTANDPGVFVATGGGGDSIFGAASGGGDATTLAPPQHAPSSGP
jgi:hypothetical protein